MARLRVVKGGTHESKTCDCTAQIGSVSAVTCCCTETKYFVGNVPDRWICPDCQKGKHKLM